MFMIRGLFLLATTAIKLRIEQELVIFRYALFCSSGLVSKTLLILRISGLLALVSLATLWCFMAHHWEVKPPLTTPILVVVYLFLMLNSLWENGWVRERIVRWRWGLLGLVVCQASFLMALAVVSNSDRVSSTSFEQVRYSNETQSLPGGLQRSQIAGLQLRKVLINESMTSVGVAQSDTAQVATNPTETSVDLAIVGKALNYPNPCRLGASGTTIGYVLTKDAPIEIRVYDPYGQEIYTENITKGLNGARGGSGVNNYNTVEVNAAKLMTTNVPAGVYYYAILSEGKLLGRGKIGALP